MDSLDTNYNPEATIDDGSYLLPVYVCADSLATNYNPEATINDGSCEYPPSALKLSSITIHSMPMTNNGSNWDIGLFGSENPDVFLF